MKYKIYTMRDRRSGLYASPFVSYNDSTAERDFRARCATSADSNLAGDLELYALGDFDIHTGEIVSWTPEFICAGEVTE